MYLEDLKFSLWCDFVERSFLEGEFVDLIEKKIINGATSNPAIFKSSFLSSPAYKSDIETLKGKSPKEIYEALAVEDIKRAAQKLLPLYERGDDGFISIEVDPNLCDDAEGTIDEGVRLFNEIDMPNVMIKVPATDAGFEAMEALVSKGINVNATLIFSNEQSNGCLEAFKNGTKKAKDNGHKIPKAVISIFVSRFDRKLDPILKEKGLELSKVGIFNALRIYNSIEKFGLENVRALFASTGVKGDDLEPDYYIRELLCYNSVNTAPLNTIKSFLDSQAAEKKVVADMEKIEEFFALLEKNGIDMRKVNDELMQEGLEAFKVAFEEIMEALKS